MDGISSVKAMPMRKESSNARSATTSRPPSPCFIKENFKVDFSIPIKNEDKTVPDANLEEERIAQDDTPVIWTGKRKKRKLLPRAAKTRNKIKSLADSIIIISDLSDDEHNTTNEMTKACYKQNDSNCVVLDKSTEHDIKEEFGAVPKQECKEVFPKQRRSTVPKSASDGDLTFTLVKEETHTVLGHHHYESDQHHAGTKIDNFTDIETGNTVAETGAMHNVCNENETNGENQNLKNQMSINTNSSSTSQNCDQHAGICCTNVNNLLDQSNRSTPHENVRNVKGTQCDKSMKKQGPDKRHTARWCKICGKPVKSIYYKRHMLNHDIPKHVCEVCQRKFSFKHSLKEHKKTHYAIRRLPCKLCPGSYKTRSELLKHFRKKHNPTSSNTNQENKSINEASKAEECEKICQICGKHVKKPSFSYHMKTHAERRFQCQICGNKFMTEGHLKRHIYTHSSVKDFKCIQCPRSYKTKTDLQRHVRVKHQSVKLSKQKDFTEDMFEDVNNTLEAEVYHTENNVPVLDLHTKQQEMIKKPSEGLVKCTECGILLRDKELDIHMLIHKENKKFQCEECGIFVSCPYYLKRHMILHKQTKTFACPLCPCTYKYSKSLTLHVKAKHTPTAKTCDAGLTVCHIIPDKKMLKTEEGHIHVLDKIHAKSCDDRLNCSDLTNRKISTEAQETVVEGYLHDKNKTQKGTCEVTLSKNVKDNSVTEAKEQPSSGGLLSTGKNATAKDTLNGGTSQEISTKEKIVSANETLKDITTPKSTASKSLVKCHICPKVLNKRSLKEHIKVMHPIKITFKKCKKCKNIVKSSHFKSHLRQHNILKDLCHICGKQIARGCLEVHIKAMHEEIEKDMNCPICNKLIRSVYLSAHMRRHKTPKYKCVICNRMFVQKEDLQQHAYTHNEDRNFACKLCNAKFKKPSSLSTHVKSVHHGIRPKKRPPSERTIPCPGCDNLFVTEMSMKRHKEVVHDGELKYGCPVGLCQERFRTKYKVRLHVNWHKREDGDKSNVCPNCGKFFNSYRVLRKHVELHCVNKVQQDRKPCKVCGKMLQPTSLRLHMRRMHEGVSTAETCPICHKTCEMLSVHMKVHEEPMEECRECGKRFRLKHQLKDHMLSHGNERKFECTFCPLKFKMAHHLRSHLKTQHHRNTQQ